MSINSLPRHLVMVVDSGPLYDHMANDLEEKGLAVFDLQIMLCGFWVNMCRTDWQRMDEKDETVGAYNGRPMRTIVIDSSSVILLQKVKLLENVLENYSIVIAESVYRELTLTEKAGVAELEKLLHNKVIRPLPDNKNLSTMGPGERDSIKLFKEGYGDFILIDDKKAAKYCKANTIPFINSLLVPRIFCSVGILRNAECWQKFRELIKAGYYSEKIVARAKGIGGRGLLKFFP